MEGARKRKQQQQQQQGSYPAAELSDGQQTPTDPETKAIGGSSAVDSLSASATGLEAVRMRLRESLAPKAGDGEGGAREPGHEE